MIRPSYIACEACRRHIRSTEVACPFCRAEVPASAPATPRATLPAGRLSRAALLALGTGAAAVACGGAVTSGSANDQNGDGAVNASPDAAGDGSQPTNGPGYGLAPSDAGASSPTETGTTQPDAASDATEENATEHDAASDAVPDHYIFIAPPYGLAPI